ncbi:MAG: hypothetical protein QNJ81_12885 [Acidimicrobiia bacterium]|nr:hypothetical protein [Acidimicrobiia bacterium]
MEAVIGAVVEIGARLLGSFPVCVFGAAVFLLATGIAARFIVFAQDHLAMRR